MVEKDPEFSAESLCLRQGMVTSGHQRPGNIYDYFKCGAGGGGGASVLHAHCEVLLGKRNATPEIKSRGL